MLDSTKIFKLLKGVWKMNRTITSQVMPQGTMEGIAFFRKVTSEKNALHYREEGVFKKDTGESFNIYRDYFYQHANDKITACFIEGNRTDRLFHVLELPHVATFPLTINAKHVCEPDNYDVQYNFYNPDEFKITYEVTGPRKNYISTTFFKRAPLEEGRTVDESYPLPRNTENRF